MKDSPRTGVLIACIGNIFLGDDAFGCEVARALRDIELPSATRLVDFGIRGIDLAYALLEPHQAVIMVDAIVRGQVPGTIYILQPAEADSSAQATPDPHSMQPAHLMAMARSLGEIVPEIYIVGCEPQDFGDELEGRMGLSHAVAAAVPEGVRAVLDLIHRVQSQGTERETTACTIA